MQDSIVRKNARELCHDADGNAYVRYGTTPAVQTWQLASRTAREWMGHAYYRGHGRIPTAAAIQDAVATLSGIATHDGPRRDIWLRSASTDGRVIHDLCDDGWRAATITPDGWTVGPSPVIFRRPATARAVAEPVRGGTISEVIDLLDLPKPDAHHVIVWIVAAIIGNAPVPVLELSGPAGSGKTTLLRRIRSMVDPHDAAARAAPRSVEDLHVAAHHSYVVAADNVSNISPDLSDALCVLCTGGGYARRRLYSTNEETVLRARRPIVITSVTPAITAADLLDRVISITLRMRSDTDRRTEAELEAKWNAALPATMGAIYDLVARVLSERPGVRLSAPPRMADYAVIGEAVSHICRWSSYAREYVAHRRDLAARGIDASPVAAALLRYMHDHPTYSGPVGRLHRELRRGRLNTDGWPRSDRGAADTLRRAAPGLTAAGLVLELEPRRRRDGYHLSIRRGPQWSV